MSYPTTNPSPTQSTLAPSEKHLEQWIVDNFPYVREAIPQFNMRRIVARQLPLSTGIPDLIVAVKLGVRVIELKKGVVDGAAVAQVIRYIGEIDYMYGWAMSRITSEDDPHYFPDDKYTPVSTPMIQGILIGHSFDKNAILACFTNHIQAWEYRYDGNGYTFDESYTDTDIDFTRYYDDDLGIAIREAMRHRRLVREDAETLREIYRQEGSL